MNTYKNLDYNRKDNTDCTHIVYCEANQAPAGNWAECSAEENSMTHLYTQAGIRYFGTL